MDDVLAVLGERCDTCEGRGTGARGHATARSVTLPTCPTCKGTGDKPAAAPDDDGVPDFDDRWGLCGLCGVRFPAPGHTACSTCA